MKTKICLICEKQFEKTHQKSKKRWRLTKYCSLPCSYKAKEKKIKSECVNCGKSYNEKPSSYKKKKKHFCSMKCYANYKRYKMQPCEQNTWKGGIPPLVSSANWRKRNRDKVRHYKLNYYARKKGAKGSHSLSEWIEVKNKFNNRCAICNAKVFLTKDHIIPLSKGGSNYIKNIQPLCRTCNSRKNNKIYENPELLNK